MTAKHIGIELLACIEIDYHKTVIFFMVNMAGGISWIAFTMSTATSRNTGGRSLFRVST